MHIHVCMDVNNRDDYRRVLCCSFCWTQCTLPVAWRRKMIPAFPRFFLGGMNSPSLLAIRTWLYFLRRYQLRYPRVLILKRSSPNTGISKKRINVIGYNRHFLLKGSAWSRKFRENNLAIGLWSSEWNVLSKNAGIICISRIFSNIDSSWETAWSHTKLGKIV